MKRGSSSACTTASKDVGVSSKTLLVNENDFVYEHTPIHAFSNELFCLIHCLSDDFGSVFLMIMLPTSERPNLDRPTSSGPDHALPRLVDAYAVQSPNHLGLLSCLAAMARAMALGTALAFSSTIVHDMSGRPFLSPCFTHLLAFPCKLDLRRQVTVLWH